MNDIAILVLRVGVAWIFAYPLHLFWQNFNAAKQAAGLINQKYSMPLAIIMLLVMALGSLAVLLGIYIKLASLCLLIFSLLGVYAHTKLSKLGQSFKNADNILVSIATEGQLTSAWKNYPIAAVCIFLVIVGGGKYCLI